MPTNEGGPGVRLSSGPEHSLLKNRPVIVTQSVLPSSPPQPLRKRGSPYSPYSPYSHVERRASARPLELKLERSATSADTPKTSAPTTRKPCRSRSGTYGCVSLMSQTERT